MSQLIFFDAEGQVKCKQTRLEKFLAQRDKLLPLSVGLKRPWFAPE